MRGWDHVCGWYGFSGIGQHIKKSVHVKGGGNGLTYIATS